MFGVSGTIAPETSNIYLILVIIWANFGWSGWLRAAAAGAEARTNSIYLSQPAAVAALITQAAAATRG